VGRMASPGMGHLWVSCNTCHDPLWQTTFYQPPHDITSINPIPGGRLRPSENAPVSRPVGRV
jgi:hypothetical protein